MLNFGVLTVYILGWFAFFYTRHRFAILDMGFNKKGGHLVILVTFSSFSDFSIFSKPLRLNVGQCLLFLSIRQVFQKLDREKQSWNQPIYSTLAFTLNLVPASTGLPLQVGHLQT